MAQHTQDMPELKLKAQYSDGQLLRTSFGKTSENRHSGDVLSMGFKKSS